MKEFKPAVELMIANLRGLADSLEEDNFSAVYGYFIICTSSFSMLSRVLESTINQKLSDINEKNKDEYYPEIIESNIEDN